MTSNQRTRCIFLLNLTFARWLQNSSFLRNIRSLYPSWAYTLLQTQRFLRNYFLCTFRIPSQRTDDLLATCPLLMDDCDDFGTSQSPLAYALSKGLTLAHLPTDPMTVGPCTRSNGSDLFLLLWSLLGFWMWIQWSRYYFLQLILWLLWSSSWALDFFPKLGDFKCFEGLGLWFISCEPFQLWVSPALWKHYPF